MGEATADLPWHVIHGGDLLELLRRAQAGEDPDTIYVEEYANADSHNPAAETDDVDRLWACIYAADQLLGCEPGHLPWMVAERHYREARALLTEEADQ